MIKRIACLVLCLAVVFGVVSFSATQAWFVAGTEKHQYLTSGDISYTVSGGFKDFTNLKILPGDELVDTALTITNSSNIDTQLRVKILFTKYNSSNVSSTEIYDSTSNNSALEVVMDSAWVRRSDNYYYYQGDSHVVLTTDTTAIPLISSVKYNGSNTGIYNSGNAVNVSVVIESKQAYYVTWTQLGTV